MRRRHLKIRLGPQGQLVRANSGRLTSLGRCIRPLLATAGRTSVDRNKSQKGLSAGGYAQEYFAGVCRHPR